VVTDGIANMYHRFSNPGKPRRAPSQASYAFEAFAPKKFSSHSKILI